MVRLFSNVSTRTKYGNGTVLHCPTTRACWETWPVVTQNTAVSLLCHFGRTTGVCVCVCGGVREIGKWREGKNGEMVE